jgi:hypothetical protein
MSNRFLLFGEKPFETYALEKFSAIASDVERMSDIEAMMYKDSFEELVHKTVSAYCFKKLDVSFENKMVDLIDRPVHMHSNIFAEYSLVVTGDAYFLGLIPYSAPSHPFHLPVMIRGNILSFEIDTHYHKEELSSEITEFVRGEYEAIKKYILDSVYNMNQTILHYNAELEKFVIPLVANKLRKAERGIRIKEALNFK